MTIAEARKEAKLKRREVCELIGIPYRTLQDWELGTHRCPEWIERLLVAEILRNKKP